MADSQTGRTSIFSQLIPGILKAAVPLLLCINIGILALYGAGTWLSDTSLRILLHIQCYSAAALALLSFCALAYTIRRLFQGLRIRFFILLVGYFICGLSGIVLVVLGTALIAITG